MPFQTDANILSSICACFLPQNEQQENMVSDKMDARSEDAKVYVQVPRI
jgi:hypothetical protein